MRLLVIGGTGFIGAPVTRALRESGHEVAVFHRGQTGADLLAGVVSIHGDRDDFAASARELLSFAPESVVDMTPMHEAHARAGIEMVARLAAGEAPRRLVAVSSMDVYLSYGRLQGTEPGPAVALPLTEDSPLREVLFPYRGRPYGSDDYEKIGVERAVLGSAAVEAVVLRLPIVYGPRDGQHRIGADLRRMDEGRAAIQVPESLADWRIARAYVDDCAWAIALAATLPAAAGRTYHVAEPDALSQEQWTREIAHAAGWNGEIVRVPDSEPPDGERVPLDTRHHLVADSSRIRSELGYAEVMGRDEGLRRTVAWERARHRA